MSWFSSLLRAKNANIFMNISYESILRNWQILFISYKSGFTQSADFLPYVKDTVCKRKMGTNIEPGRSSYRSNLPPVYEVTITNNYASEERPFYDDLLIVT